MISLVIPGNMIIAGSTQSGKTTWITSLILSRDKTFSKPVSRVHYYYSEWQPIFNRLEMNGVMFEQGPPNVDTMDNIEPYSIIVLDDLMSSLCKSKELMELFTVKSHHR